MKVLGITGGVGSGKSQVLAYLESEYQAVVCQMDEVAKQLQKKGTPCYRQILRQFGTEIAGPDGEIDRVRLGTAGFSDAGKLRLLNGIVHPAVLEWVRRDIEDKASRGVKLYVVEAALLPDVGAGLCDELWYVYAPEKVRYRRLRDSRGYSEEKTARMIESQPSENRFRQVCTAVIDNSGTFEDTKKQIGDKLTL